jgi:hypothetical protein
MAGREHDKHEDAIAGPLEREACDCCHHVRDLWLYLLQNCETAWVCDDCRNKGKSKP